MCLRRSETSPVDCQLINNTFSGHNSPSFPLCHWSMSVSVVIRYLFSAHFKGICHRRPLC